MHDVLKSFKQKPVPKISQKSSKFLKNPKIYQKIPKVRSETWRKHRVDPI